MTRSKHFAFLAIVVAVVLLAITSGRLAAQQPSQGQKLANAAQHKDMDLVGFSDLQARSAYQPIVQRQGTRWIAYIGHHGGNSPNTTKPGAPVEPNGTSIVDVTDPSRPVYLAHIPGQFCPTCTPENNEAGAAQMVRACDGATLPHGVPGRTYLLRNFGQIAHEMWDVTNPASPQPIHTVSTGNPIVSGLTDTHKSWWECDTGVAYLVSGDPDWRTGRMTKIFNLSDPANPVFIRDFGLNGQQPGAVGPVPTQLHGPISLGPNGLPDGSGKNRVYFGYGTGSNGIIQIVDRDKLLNDPSLTPATRHMPTVAQLAFPQVGRLDMYPAGGAHTTYPVLRMPVPDFADDQQGSVRDFLVVTNEAGGNQCTGNRQMVFVVDISSESKMFSIANFNVPESSGDFCNRGGRFGSHSSHESFTPLFYKKMTFHSWFNAGVRAVDIRDPFNPVEAGYYIPPVTANTAQRCATINGVTTCKIAIQTNNVEVDERGYIYIVDRANTGLHILQLSGDAKKIISP
jgi:hypothetical protein